MFTFAFRNTKNTKNTENKMKRKYRALFYIAIFITITSCSSAHAAKNLTDVPLPEVPIEIREPQARADYIIENFWDKADTLSLYNRDVVEQAFSNFISVFPIASDEARGRAVKKLMKKASDSKKDYSLIAEIADVYLYSTDSPIESEEYYILFLNEIVNSDLLDDDDKIRPAFQLENALKNRPGNIVADFDFETRDGRKTSLHNEIGSLSPDAEMLLIFYDPDCGHCRDIMDKIISTAEISDRVASGKLNVLAVYSGDDYDLWKEKASELPPAWTVGYEDATMQEEGKFVIRTLPTLYRISPDKTVIEKEAWF